MNMLNRYGYQFVILLGVVMMALFINSCKKDNSDTVSYFLTSGTWQLASVQTQRFVGDTLKRTDTLNTNCGLNQIFQFKNDNTCTLSNYHCITQTSSGSWQFSSDNLSLQTTLSASDTLNKAIVTVKAFDNAQIENLGQYSLVLKTGYTSSYYTSKTVRVITRYGFVHPTNQ